MRTRELLLLAILAGWPVAAAERELAGRVVDASTGEPIGHAHVTLRFFQGGQPAPEVTLLSDTDGSFRVTKIPEGAYQISCQKAGYLAGNQFVQANRSADGKDAASVVVKLTAQAAIEGTVVDDRDMPVENTFIQLIEQQVFNGRRRFQPTNGGGTDETGYFRMFGLPAGRYYLFIAARFNPRRRSKPLAYPPLYYPNATEIAAAQTIDLKAGDDRQIRIKLPEPVPAWEIRGTVGGSAVNVGIQVTRLPLSQPQFSPNLETNWDAKTRIFRVSHLTPGTYLLTASAQDGKTWRQANATVTVGNADVTGVRLEAADVGFDGTVRIDGDAGQQPMVGYVIFHSQGNGYNAQVGPDGKFSVINLQPDTYRVMPQINSPQWCVRSVEQGGRDVRDSLAIATAGTPGPVEIVVTGHCGSIDVKLAPSDAEPPPNLTAVLLRKAGDEWVLEKQSYLGGRTADPALHLLQGITPGEYMLYAWPQELQVEYADAEYMRQFEGYGKAVTVTEDAKVSVTIDRVLLSTAKN